MEWGDGKANECNFMCRIKMGVCSVLHPLCAQWDMWSQDVSVALCSLCAVRMCVCSIVFFVCSQDVCL